MRTSSLLHVLVLLTKAASLWGFLQHAHTSSLHATGSGSCHPQQHDFRIRSSALRSTTERSSNKNRTSRYLAVEALIVKKKQKDLDAVSRLESTQAFLNSSQRDKAFARNLVSTTSRRLGQIDAVLEQCCDVYPPKGKQGGVVQACLRIGVAQLLFLDTPAFAALSETVEVLKGGGFRLSKPMVSFCNAILRRVQREGEEMLKGTDECDNISDFLKGEFLDLYGKENTGKIVGQLLNQDSHRNIDLTVKSDENSLNELIESFEADDGERFDSISPLPNGSIRIGKGPKAGAIRDWPLYDAGKWWVQDISSTLPAIALTKALRSKFGEMHNMNDVNVVDMCAAPGGKTSQLLSAGFQVTAIEASPRRSRRLLENLERLKFGEDQCQVVVSPGQEWLPKRDNGEDLKIDGILVDVPCSATGTGNKRPDVLRKDGDLGNLLETQEILANHCADNILQSGGIMIYATCSLLARESEDQVHKLLKRGTMKTLPFVEGEIPGFDGAIDENGWLRVLPGVLEAEMAQCDGFFVARLEKI